jgi:hypothetical protein
MSSRGEPVQEREGEDAPSSSPERKRKSVDEEAKTEESKLGETEPRQLSKQSKQSKPSQPQLIQQQIQQQPQPTGHGGPLDKAPRFNANDDALDIFSQPFFEPYEHLSEQRNGVLGGNTIYKVLRRFFDNEEGKGPLGRLSQEMGVRFASVREYYETADLTTKQQLASARMKARYGCDFQVAEISNVEIDSALLPLLPVDGDGDDIARRTIDLELLNPLRVQRDEPFLVPDKIFVRDCMRFVFGLFREDENGDDNATPREPRRPPNKDYAAALIGSPGVGKSILCFLAALHQAKTSPIVFYRKSRKGPISVFVMSPHSRSSSSNDPSFVRVWFTRNLTLVSAAEQQGLAVVNADLITCGVVDKRVCYTFIDGPTLPRRNTQAHTNDALDGNYDYFCTSGGFSGYHFEQDENRLWVLDGWTEKEAVLALGMLGKSEEDAEMAFALCGGSIRNMIRSTSNAEEVTTKLDNLIDRLTQEAVALAATSTRRSDDPDHPDRLRTMFELRGTTSEATRKKLMRAYQRVDSRYALKRLCTGLSMSPFFDAYRLAQTIKVGTGEGVFFEHIVHQWAMNNKDSNEIRCFSRVYWSSGTVEESVEQLSTPDVYWIPSKQNFPNIDSALVHNHTLFAFQMTISSTHKFDRVTFERNFVENVRVKCQVHRVVLYFVHPLEVAFRIPNNLPAIPRLTRLRSRIGFVARTLAARVGAEAWAGAPALECGAIGIDTRSEVHMSNSLTTMFRGL